MKKLTKNLMFIFLMTVLCIAMATSANAETYTGNCGAEGDNVTWLLDTETGILTIQGEGAMEDYSFGGNPPPTWAQYKNDIKSVIIKSGVTRIGDWTFSYYNNHASIIVPDSVSSIGERALLGCRNLDSINVDENNNWYSNDDFGVLFNKDKTRLIKYPTNNVRSEYIIPDTVTYIEDYAFYFCENIKNIIIPSNVKGIFNYSFGYCYDLTNIVIPDSVITIYGNAFEDCHSLTSIIVDENNKYFSSDEFGVLFNKNKTELIQFPANKVCEKYVIPSSVTKIDLNAFRNCSKIKSVELPEGITKIDNFMFDNCSELTTIKIPDSVTSIGRQGFYGCKIKSISISENVTSIDDLAFACCYDLTDVYYSGTKEKWSQILIGVSNDNLTNATIYFHYNNHKYISAITTPATHSTTGVETFICECGDTHIEEIAKLEGHTYTPEVTTEATHTTVGVKTFTCECGDTYTEEIAKLTEHTYTPEVTKEATHLAEGVKTYTCACGDSYTEAVAKNLEHTYRASKIIDPTCENAGYTTYICRCGESRNDDFVPEKGHSYSGQMCTSCGKKCDDMCHKSGFMSLLWKIMNFFYRIFGTNKECYCGVAHY